MVKLPQEPSDPKLKEAMAEIVAVLKKHDIAGIALLQSKTHGEWLNGIDPTWSCAKMDGQSLRIKAPAKDYPSTEDRNEAIRLTAGMIYAFRDGAHRIADNMESVLAMLSKYTTIEHVSRFDR
jgi:hypothetical protein